METRQATSARDEFVTGDGARHRGIWIFGLNVLNLQYEMKFNPLNSMTYVFLAPGFEEIEAVAPIDIMRRAGMEVTSVAVTTDGSGAVEGAHGVPYVADIHIDELAEDVEAEWLVLPGGMPGASNLHECEKLLALLRKTAGGIAAICASPAVVLGAEGLLEGKPATCYPGFEDLCRGAEMTGAPVVTAPGLITAKGPAFATDFGLAIVNAALGEEKADEVARGMLL